MILGENCKPEIQRIRYKKGQLLASRDLRDDSNIGATLRWLHNRALHDVYGVNDGMAVTRVDESGNPVYEGADFVALEISEGLAYDCFGRELILYEARRVPLPLFPPSVKTMTLLIHYKDTATFPRRDVAQGSCIPGELSPLSEQPEFLWKPDSLVELVDGVPLVKISYKDPQNSQLELGDKSEPPVSRPLARPRIARGSTIPGNTIWEVWTESVGESEYAVGVQTKIDTSAEGFTETPCYFACLQGSLWIEENQEFFLAPLESIHDDTSTGFTFRLMLPSIALPNGSTSNENFDEDSFFIFAKKEKHKLYVSWVGIECTECVRELKPPVAVISTDPDPPIGPPSLEVTFDGSSSYDPDGTIVSYEWDFNDGSPKSNEKRPTHSYSGGDHTAILTVTDDHGFTSSAEVRIIVLVG